MRPSSALAQTAVIAVYLVSLLALPRVAQAQLTLGSFTFNVDQFGDTLTESDGGSNRNQQFLNTVNADPGNPGALTGANFDTGIANIGIAGSATYTIGYNTPIVNGAGNDFGVVAAFDTFKSANLSLAVSTDGVNFIGPLTFTYLSGAQSTGVSRDYVYAPFPDDLQTSELLVLPLDLGTFGLTLGQSIRAVQFTSSNGADIIRIAGLGTAATSAAPEPGSLILLLPVIGVVGIVIRRRSK